MSRPQRCLGAISICVYCCLALAAFSTQAQASNGATSLSVEVRGLPSGARSSIVVNGPHHFHKVLHRSTKLRHIPNGKYRIVASPAQLSRRFKGIPAGSRAFPVKRKIRVKVGAGKAKTARVRYGTIRSSRVVVLRKSPLRVIGPKRNPKAIVLPASIAKRVGKGSILTSAPRAALPGGLFNRVTRVSRGHHPQVHLEAASLWDAFPALDLKAVTPLHTGFAESGSASASGFDDVDLAFSKTLIKDRLEASCGAPPTGWSLSPSGSLHSWVASDLHRRYLALPYGQLTITVQGKIGLAATIPTGVHCDISIAGPKLQAAIIVFGVPVPVGGKVDLNVSLQNDSPITARFDATVTATAGIDLAGRKTKPIIAVKNQATGSVNAITGALSVGPAFQAGLGAISGLNAHLSIEPQVTAKASRTSCEIDVGVNAGVGLDLGSFHPSYTPFTPSTPVYKCPLPDGVFFDAGPGTGPPPSTLGPYTMTRFGPDPQGIGDVTGVSDPAGRLEFPGGLSHQLVGQGWATWSNDYQGDVYLSDDSNTATVNLPAGTRAFYLYAEPNVFADFNVTATTGDGTSSGPITVYGDSGASFFGFYATGSRTLSQITVSANDLVAVGEFGIAH
jgi:hypothetical protein